MIGRLVALDAALVRGVAELNAGFGEDAGQVRQRLKEH